MTELLDELDLRNTEIPWLRSQAISTSNGSLCIELDLMFGDEVHSRWLVDCLDTFEHRFSLGGHGTISIDPEHVLLLDHLDRRAQLYFRGSPGNPGALLDALTVAHEELMGGWRPLKRYLNASLEWADLLAGPGGQLAVGPTTVLAAYQTVVVSHGVDANLLDAGVAKHWNHERQWKEVDGSTSVLLLSDWSVNPFPGPDPSSYVVAADFAVRRIAG